MPSSPITSETLLVKLRNEDGDGWQKLFAIYGPLIAFWCERCGVSGADAEDTRQEVFKSLHRSISTFRRDEESQSFRAWLWTITRNQIVSDSRKKREVAIGGTAAVALANNLPEKEPLEISSAYPQKLTIQRILQVVSQDFEVQTQKAFYRTVIDELPASEVAEEMNMTPAAVRKAKSRVLNRLRSEFKELL